ncbi:OadG family protein [Candidatus Riflebacteria bacterium]
MGIENIIQGKGFEITITGMLIVFAGLGLLSLAIYILPMAINFFDQLFVSAKKLEGKEQQKIVADTDAEILAAIGLVLHMEMERFHTEHQKITFRPMDSHFSMWASAGKLRALPGRGRNAKI